MAIKYYLGVDGDWSNVNNWTAAAIPVDADDVKILGTTSQSLTMNLDRTGDGGGSGLHLNSLYVARDYVGNIGALGAELKCTVQNSTFADASITHRGPGELWFNSETGTGGHVTGQIILNSDNKDSALTLGGDRDIGRLCIAKGLGTLSAAFSGILCNVDISLRVDRANDAKFIAASTAGPAITLIQTAGGVVSVARAVTMAVVSQGANYTQEDYGLAQLYQSGGLMFFNTSSDVADLDMASLTGGTLDMTQNSYPKVISNLYQAPGATLTKTSQTTVTNDYPFDEETD